MARQESAAAAFWNDETRMWLNWEKYRDPVVQLTLLPNKRLLETTVPYYLLGLKPPEQTLGRAGIWKKIAQTMEDAKLTRPRDRKERAAKEISERVHLTERREQKPERPRQRALRSNGLKSNAARRSQLSVRAEEQSRRTTEPLMPTGAAQPAPIPKKSDSPPLVRMRDRPNPLQKVRTLEDFATQSSKRFRSG